MDSRSTTTINTKLVKLAWLPALTAFPCAYMQGWNLHGSTWKIYGEEQRTPVPVPQGSQSNTVQKENPGWKWSEKQNKWWGPCECEICQLNAQKSTSWAIILLSCLWVQLDSLWLDRINATLGLIYCHVGAEQWAVNSTLTHYQLREPLKEKREGKAFPWSLSHSLWSGPCRPAIFSF